MVEIVQTLNFKKMFMAHERPIVPLSFWIPPWIYQNKEKNITYQLLLLFISFTHNGAFTLDIKLVLNENLGGILGGRHPMLNEQ
jgi:hypothetical protein